MGETTAALIGLALAAAGTGVSMSASAAEKDAMNDKTKAEVLRQQGIQKKSTGEFERSLAASAPNVGRQQIDKGTDSRLIDLQKAATVPIGGASPLDDQSAPNAVQAGQGAAQVAQQAQAKAKLGGYSDFDLEQWIKNLRAQQQIGMYSQMARQSAQVLPYELQAAARSAEDMRAAGTGLSAAGSLVGLGGAAGAFGSASSVGEEAAAAHAGANAGMTAEQVASAGGSAAVNAARMSGTLGALAPASQFSWLNFLTGLGRQAPGMFSQMSQQPKPQSSVYGSIYGQQ